MKPLVLICALSAAALSQQLPDSMLKVVVTMEGPAAVKDPFLTKPRTMYRAGDKYCRISELPNPVKNAEALTVVNEPESWVVNRVTETGRHYVDPGPDLVCRMPMLLRSINGTEDKNSLIELEYGRELAYFKQKGATPKPGPVMRGKETQQYTIPIRDSQVTLYTTGTPERPVAVIRQHGKVTETYWYEEFEQLPFDPKMFAMPEGIIKMRDIK